MVASPRLLEGVPVPKAADAAEMNNYVGLSAAQSAPFSQSLIAAVMANCQNIEDSTAYRSIGSKFALHDSSLAMHVRACHQAARQARCVWRSQYGT